MWAAVVVNADDLGVSRGATLGIVRAHKQGVVTSASLTVTTQAYEHALKHCVQACPELGIGLHFTLSAGRPASHPDLVPRLVNREGFLRWRFASLFASLRGPAGEELLRQIAVELEAQLERARGDGVALDHIDSERHVHLIPGILEVVLNSAKREGIPFVRLGRDTGWRYSRIKHLHPLLVQGGIAKYSILSSLTRRTRRLNHQGVQSADKFASYLFSGRLDYILGDILNRPPTNSLTEVMVHPGVPEMSRGIDLGNRQLESYVASRDRWTELQACLDAQPAAWVKLVSFRQAAQLRKEIAGD